MSQKLLADYAAIVVCKRHPVGRFLGMSRSRILERTFSLRFLGVILRVFRLEVFTYIVYITNQFQTTIAHGVGGVKCVNRGDCE